MQSREIGYRCLYFTHGLQGPHGVRQSKPHACAKPQTISITHIFFILSPLCTSQLSSFGRVPSILCGVHCVVCKTASWRAWAHSGQRNWRGCYLPVARRCPKYYTHTMSWDTRASLKMESRYLCLYLVPCWWHHSNGRVITVSVRGPSVLCNINCNSDFFCRTGLCAIWMCFKAVLGLVCPETPWGCWVSKSLCECDC